MRYTFSDEEDSDDFPSRRSTRNSGVSTPVEHAGPTVTASGRQVKSRLGGMYGETMLVDQRKELESERAAVSVADNERDHDESIRRPQRPGRPKRIVRAPRRIDDSSEDAMNGQSDGASSANEWSGNEDEPDGQEDAEEFEADGKDEDKEMSTADSEMGDAGPTEQDSLVVQLRYKKEGQSSKQKGRPGSLNGVETAADCIAVDSGQPAKASGRMAQVNGKAVKHGEAGTTMINGPLHSIPSKSAHGASPLQLGAGSKESLVKPEAPPLQPSA